MSENWPKVKECHKSVGEKSGLGKLLLVFDSWSRAPLYSDCGQVVHIVVPLSPSSIIMYQALGKVTVGLTGLFVRLQVQGLRTDDKHPAYARLWSLASFCVIFLR